MSTITQNYGLIKPAQNDHYSINQFNENMDIIDEKLGGIYRATAAGVEAPNVPFLHLDIPDFVYRDGVIVGATMPAGITDYHTIIKADDQTGQIYVSDLRPLDWSTGGLLAPGAFALFQWDEKNSRWLLLNPVLRENPFCITGSAIANSSGDIHVYLGARPKSVLLRFESECNWSTTMMIPHITLLRSDSTSVRQQFDEDGFWHGYEGRSAFARVHYVAFM